MFGYYLDLAWRSLRRHWIMTTLMVLAIGLGIGASMTMITVLHVMSGDPLPQASATLYVPMLDPRSSGHGQTGVGGTPDGFTWVDAMNLLHAERADRQAAMNAGSVAMQSMEAESHPFFEIGEYVTADFFAMFGARFQSGGGWTADEGRDSARVVVLSHALNRKLFGDTSGVGKTVRLNDTDFRVVGILDSWYPQPKFYAQGGGRVFGAADQFFLPLQTALDLKFALPGHFACWGDIGDQRKSDHCTWLQFWVELDSPAKVLAYRRFLTDYQADQHAHGRFPANPPPRLFDLMSWLAHEQIVPANLSMQMWLAIGFLCVCLLSVVALLLAKFLRRAPAISIRRAMGARRRDIFIQCATESALIGAFGGLLGLAVTQLGLWLIRHSPDNYAHLAQTDMSMLLSTVALALVTGVLAGLLPAWRVCQIPPALQLKAQ